MQQHSLNDYHQRSMRAYAMNCAEVSNCQEIRVQDPHNEANFHALKTFTFSEVPMDLFDAIFSRYSYRGEFLEDVPSEADVERILDAAIAAPAGVNIRTTSFVVVTDKELLSQLQKTTKLCAAPLSILVLSEDIPNKLRRNFETENYCVVAQNLLLAVTALGYATVLNDIIFTYSEINKPVRKLLNIPKNKKIKAIFNIGKPANPGAPMPKPARDTLVQYNAF